LGLFFAVRTKEIRLNSAFANHVQSDYVLVFTLDYYLDQI
jgi:hypothetical protein